MAKPVAELFDLANSLGARYDLTDPDLIAKQVFPKPTSTRGGPEFLHINVYGLALLVLSDNNTATVLFPKGAEADPHELFVSKVEDDEKVTRLTGFQHALTSVMGLAASGTPVQTIRAEDQSAPFQTFDSVLDVRRGVGQRELKSFRTMLDELRLNAALTIESPFIEIGAPFSPFGWIVIWDVNGEEVICTDNFYFVVPVKRDEFGFERRSFGAPYPVQRAPRRVRAETPNKRTAKPLQYSFANVDRCLDRTSKKAKARPARSKNDAVVLSEIIHAYGLFQRVQDPDALPKPTLSRSILGLKSTDEGFVRFLNLVLMSSCSSPVCASHVCYQLNWEPLIELPPR